MIGRRVLCRRLFMTHRFLMPISELRLDNGDGRVGFAAHRSARSTLHPLPDDFCHRLINGAGVGLLFGDAELGQHVDDGVRGDLKLPGQLIDSDFTHKYRQRLLAPRLTDPLRVLYSIKFLFLIRHVGGSGNMRGFHCFGAAGGGSGFGFQHRSAGGFLARIR